MVMWVSTAILVVLMVVIGNALPEDYRFSRAQGLTIWALIALVGVLAYGITRSRVVADDQTITIVNGFRRRRLDWSRVESVSMRQGAPWPTLTTRDDERIALFAIQGSDGESAREAVRWLRGRLS